MTETLDIDTPEGARKYIAHASTNLLHGKTIDQVEIGGRWVHFNNMTDDEAIKIARSLYLDIELPAAAAARKQ